MHTTATAGQGFDPEAIRVGLTIREMRKLRGMTQEDLAKAALISRAYVASIEVGRKLASTRAIALIAAALGVTQWSLIRADQPKSAA